MKRKLHTSIIAAVVALLFMTVGSANAALIGQLGVLDTSGINPNSGLSWQLGDTYRLTFVTSGRRDATSTSMADYDAFVQNAADNSSLGLGAATWQALGSTIGVNSRDRVGMSGAGSEAVIRLDGVTIANDNNDFWNNSLDAPNNLDENGDPIVGDSRVWGGMFANGSPESSRHLGSILIDGKGGNRGHRGDANRTDAAWARVFHDLTSTDLRFYAMSEILTVQAEATIPEPTTATLGLIGLAGLLVRRRRAA